MLLNLCTLINNPDFRPAGETGPESGEGVSATMRLERMARTTFFSVRIDLSLAAGAVLAVSQEAASVKSPSSDSQCAGKSNLKDFVEILNRRLPIASQKRF